MDIFVNKKVWESFTEEEYQCYINEVFTYYRSHGFPYYPTDKSYRDKEFNRLNKYNDNVLIDKALKQTMHGLGLAWSYFPHMFGISCNGLKTPIDIFNDDVLFRKVIEKRMKRGDNMSDAGIRKTLKIFTGAQAVSNFRPTSAKALYDVFATNGVVWDMCGGFGGRILGFQVSNARKYICTEPSTKTYQGLLELKSDYISKNSEIYHCGCEDYIPDKNSLDFCFTSPPYFNTEHYSNEDTQSYIKYPTKELWANKFLKTMFSNCYYGLKKDKYMAINIANVKSFNNLEDVTVDMAKSVGFHYINKYYYLLSSLSKKSKFKYEPVFIFKKV